MKKLLLFIAISFLFFAMPEHASAKLLPQALSAPKTPIVRSGVTGGSLAVSVRVRRDRRALLVYFSNIQAASTISYTLIYTTSGHEEGAGGSVREDEGNTASRELLFGTCSSGVCRYHTGITNMSFEVTGTLKSGKSFTKRYKIKI